MADRTFLNKTERSYIDVILKDGTYHHFTPRVLDILLESHRVYKFKRSSGWATVGSDPLRSQKPESKICHYHGPDRRGL
ncbi:MAG: GSU3473 family protein [Desulfuromonadales bacterium]